MDKGSAAEHIAIAALMLNGYDVFKNASPNGNSDVLVRKDGVLMSLQVKAFYTYKRGKWTQKVADTRSTARGSNRHKHYAALVDLMAFVDTDTAEVFVCAPPKQKSSVSVDQLSGCRIYPIGS